MASWRADTGVSPDAPHIKTAADDVRDAMSKLENNIPAPKSLTDTFGTLNEHATPNRAVIQ